MHPTKGRIVLFHGIKYNDDFEHPAIITKVYTPYCVRLTVFPCGALPFFTDSVMQNEKPTDEDGYNGSYSWRWPPRVSE